MQPLLCSLSVDWCHMYQILDWPFLPGLLKGHSLAKQLVPRYLRGYRRTGFTVGKRACLHFPRCLTLERLRLLTSSYLSVVIAHTHTKNKKKKKKAEEIENSNRDSNIES